VLHGLIDHLTAGSDEGDSEELGQVKKGILAVKGIG